MQFKFRELPNDDRYTYTETGAGNVKKNFCECTRVLNSLLVVLIGVFLILQKQSLQLFISQKKSQRVKKF